MKIEATGEALGAVVTGLDLSAPLSTAVTAELRAAWLEALVLVFPNQPIPSSAYLRFARLFGSIAEYPFLDGLPGFPDIIEVKKLAHETTNFGGIWHSDTAYLAQPPMASMLLAKEVPPVGGDTEFANMYAAWDRLPADLQSVIEPLQAVNRSDLSQTAVTRADRIADQGVDQAPTFTAIHPAVRTHPETGRKSLYVNIAHTSHFAGMSESASRPILEAIFEHQRRPEFVWALQWQPGTIALWDNRCTLHNPRNDYHGHRRVMHRITLAGDTPS